MHTYKQLHTDAFRCIRTDCKLFGFDEVHLTTPK